MKQAKVIGHLPSFEVINQILAAVGFGKTVKKTQSINFPTGNCQIWAFDGAVIAVFLQDRAMKSWKRFDGDFSAAVAHYRHQARMRTDKSAVAKPLRMPLLPAGVKAVF